MKERARQKKKEREEEKGEREKECEEGFSSWGGFVKREKKSFYGDFLCLMYLRYKAFISLTMQKAGRSSATTSRQTLTLPIETSTSTTILLILLILI